MPEFPKPVVKGPCLDPKPLEGLRSLHVEVDVITIDWKGAFFPHMRRELETMVRDWIRRPHLNPECEKSNSVLCVEIHYKSLLPNRGAGAGFDIRVETFLKEKGKINRTECVLNVITWSCPQSFWFCTIPQSTEQIVKGIRGEVQRQADLFIDHWHRENPNCPQTVACEPALDGPCPKYEPNREQSWGVNLLHLSYCNQDSRFSQINPGISLSLQSTTIDRLYKSGARLFRIAFQWERLQPILAGSVEYKSSYFESIKETVRAVGKAGGQCILSLTNSYQYAYEKDGMITHWKIGDKESPVTGHHLKQLWEKVAKEFALDENVYGYHIMDKPLKVNRQEWCQISNDIVDAITKCNKEGKEKWLFIEGIDESKAQEWKLKQSSPWIKYDRTIYCARTTYCDLQQPAESSLMDFHEWCLHHKVNGFLSQVWIDYEQANAQELMNRFAKAARNARLGWCLWPRERDLNFEKTVFPQ